MTETKKRKIVNLVWDLVQNAKEWGRIQGLKSGIEGTSRFNAGVAPDDIINKTAEDTEKSMNELLVLLEMPEYQEYNYTLDPDAVVAPDDIINKADDDTEQSVNELLDLLGLTECQEHNE